VQNQNQKQSAVVTLSYNPPPGKGKIKKKNDFAYFQNQQFVTFSQSLFELLHT